MNRLVWGTLCFLLITSPSAIAGSPGKNGNGRGSSATHGGRDGGATLYFFSTDHVRVLRSYYGPRFRQLPPGLQKKYARTGQLPPGWQKKMEPLPVAIERELPPLPSGYRRGVIDGHAIVYSSRAGTIIDVAVLF